MPPPRAGRLGFDAVYLWRIEIPPGGRIVVRNTFRFGGSSSMGPARICFGGQRRAALKEVFWSRVEPPAGGLDFDQGSTCNSVTYIATTGRTWGGPIGEAEIAIQIPPHVWPHLFVPVPAATSVSGGWVRWRFRNWTPRTDLHLVLVTPIPGKPPLFNSQKETRAWLRFARRSGFAPGVVAALREAYEAFYGAAPAEGIKGFYKTEHWEESSSSPEARSGRRPRDAAAISAMERFEARAGRVPRGRRRNKE
jgi:hypothetical protein